MEQHDFTSWWIRFAQKRKYGKNNPAAVWNHCFMVAGVHGEIIEADPQGVSRANLLKYTGQDVALRRPPYQPTSVSNGVIHPGGAQDAVAAMEELLRAHTSYGFLTIASVALSMLTGTRLRFGLQGTEICSGAVSYALTRANIDMGTDAEFDTPADVMHVAIEQGWSVC